MTIYPEDEENHGYSFVCLVKTMDEPQNWVSTTMLKRDGIPENVAQLLAHGPFVEAVQAMVEWSSEYVVIENGV